MTKILLQCLFAFAACVGYGIVFNVHKLKYYLFPALGGALGWGAYLLLSGPVQSDLFRFFIATVVVAIYAEAMARVFKTPATIFLLIGILPLVPGGGIYYTMEYCISGNTNQFLETGLHTLGIAGSLAVGILLVSSVVRLWSNVRQKKA